MNLKGLCAGVYPSFPQLTSQDKFIDALFKVAGGNPYISKSYKKQLFSGGKLFVDNLKASFCGKDIKIAIDINAGG